MGANPLNPRGIIDLRLILTGRTPTDVANILTEASTSPSLLRARMAALVAAGADGAGGVGLVARARGVTIPQATSSFTVTESSSTVGDKLILILPSGPIELTCVADSADSGPAGTFAGNASDNAYATSIRAAINNYPPCKNVVTAGGSTNTVALTAVSGGTIGNEIKLVKQVTTAGTFSFTSGVAFSGGISLNTAKTALITVGTNPTANDTLRFGNVVLTWKASATSENEVTIGGDTTISATNLAAKIAAHSILGGIVTESHSTNTVTISSAYPDLLAALLYIASSAGTVTVANQLAPTGMTFTASAAVAATDGVF